MPSLCIALYVNTHCWREEGARSAVAGGQHGVRVAGRGIVLLQGGRHGCRSKHKPLCSFYKGMLPRSPSSPPTSAQNWSSPALHSAQLRQVST